MNELIVALLFFIDINTSISTHNAPLPQIVTSVSFNPQVEHHHDQDIDHINEQENPVYNQQQNKEFNGAVLGLYAYEESKIYLSKNVDLNTVYGQSILLHEMVHHLQYSLDDELLEDVLSHKICASELERDAYNIQNLFLQSRGYSDLISKEHIEQVSEDCT